MSKHRSNFHAAWSAEAASATRRRREREAKDDPESQAGEQMSLSGKEKVVRRRRAFGRTHADGLCARLRTAASVRPASRDCRRCIVQRRNEPAAAIYTARAEG
jgi:hypothetical protein